MRFLSPPTESAGTKNRPGLLPHREDYTVIAQSRPATQPTAPPARGPTLPGCRIFVLDRDEARLRF